MNKAPGKKVIYSFFGPPGSGKGTLAQRCAQELDFRVLSTGDLCRKHVEMGTDFGKALAAMKNGHLVPDDLITNAVYEWINEQGNNADRIILDGYPRTVGQAQSFLKILRKTLPDYCFYVILFEISDRAVTERMLNRLVCSNRDCQKIFSKKSSNSQGPACEVCGSALKSRADDALEVIKERLSLYPRHKEELFAYFKRVHQNVVVFDVESMSKEDVFEAFKRHL